MPNFAHEFEEIPLKVILNREKELFVDFMQENSEVWRNNHSEWKNDFTIVVLHSCFTGK